MLPAAKGIKLVTLGSSTVGNSSIVIWCTWDRSNEMRWRLLGRLS
jgi:hypothetical protein